MNNLKEKNKINEPKTFEEAMSFVKNLMEYEKYYLERIKTMNELGQDDRIDTACDYRTECLSTQFEQLFGETL